jgi:hypothetical protein
VFLQIFFSNKLIDSVHVVSLSNLLVQLFRLVDFYIENIIYLLTQNSTLMRRSRVLRLLSLQLEFSVLVIRESNYRML